MWGRGLEGTELRAVAQQAGKRVACTEFLGFFCLGSEGPPGLRAWKLGSYKGLGFKNLRFS